MTKDLTWLLGQASNHAGLGWRGRVQSTLKKAFVGPSIGPTQLGRASPVPAHPGWLGWVQPNLYLII
jgi:hypothetical protein